MSGSGIVFHEKKANYNDGYHAYGNITVPKYNEMRGGANMQPTFVAYAQFGCHRPEGNFDAGIQVMADGYYKVIINGGSVLKKNLKYGPNSTTTWYESDPFTPTMNGSFYIHSRVRSDFSDKRQSYCSLLLGGNKCRI